MDKLDLSEIKKNLNLDFYKTSEMLPRPNGQIVFITYESFVVLDKKTQNFLDYGRIFSGYLKKYRSGPPYFVYSGKKTVVKISIDKVAYWGQLHYLNFDNEESKN